MTAATRHAARHAGLLGLAALLALGFGCGQDDEIFSGSLDTPGPVGMVRGVGVFARPVAMSADQHGGRVRLLDLTTGRYASTTPHASFLRDAALPLGRDRLITAVAGLAAPSGTLDVWALDARHNHLIRAPWFEGTDGAGVPLRVEPVVTNVVSTPAGGGTAEASAVVLDRGQATSETFTLTFDGAQWQVRGSRSGPEAPAPKVGTWVSDGGAVRLVLSGEPLEGDRIEVQIEAGVQEWDLGGAPQGMHLSRNGFHLAVSAGDTLYVLTTVPEATPDTLVPAVTLPTGAQPGRIDEDRDGQLWIADLALPAVHRYDPSTTTLVTLPMPWPVRDVAPVTSADGRARLAVAPLDGAPSVWLYDLFDDAFVDVNPSTPGVDGMTFLAPVEGLSAFEEPYELPFQRDPYDGDAFGADLSQTTIAISLASGKIVFMQADTGCLASDRLGPRTRRRNSGTTFGDYTPEFSADPPFTAYLSAAEDSTRHVVVNACAGLARQETWELTYDAIRGAWFADGTVTGLLTTPIREDARYTADNGQFSLLMRAGAAPSVDGWRLSFDVLDGILAGSAAGVADDLPQITFDLPGEPLAYVRPRGPTDDDEREDAVIPEVVVSARSEDVVVRIDARDGLITGIWD